MMMWFVSRCQFCCNVYLFVYFEGFRPSGSGTISGGRVGCGPVPVAARSKA